MTKQTEDALKMAYDWLNEYAPPEVVQACKEALEQPNLTYEDGFAHGYEAHRAEQALEQPAQKPVAERFLMKDKGKSYWAYSDYENSNGWQPLYTHPAPPAQEPVAWTSTKALQNAKLLGAGDLWLEFDENYAMDAKEIGSKSKQIPLYTHPAPSWQGLSDDEMLVRKWKDAYKILE